MQSPLEQLNPQHSGVHTEFQTINADYYNLTDLDGWPVAGLLVLADRRGRAVRAELHLYEETIEQTQEMAIRHAHNLLLERYHRQSTENPRLPLRVMRTRQEEDTRYLQLEQNASDTSLFGKYWQWGAVALGALLILLLVIWGVSSLFGGAETGAEPVAVTTPVTTSDTASGADPISATPDQSSETGAQTNNLPPSRNARPLNLNQRVRIRPPYSSALRSEPGNDNGQEVGYLQDQQEALILGGPVWMAGETDTIVWWYVRLDSGLEGWTPANTSQLTLLEAVP